MNRPSSSQPAIPVKAKRKPRSGEEGYTYIVLLFMLLTMIIGAQVALQVLATDGRREREREMIWRGNQWARAVRLYFHKTGHYPQSVEDLQKGLPELHFLRPEAYKDPMNTDEDGAWRFIYVNATGQIIGSTKYATLQQMAILDLNNGLIPTIPTNFPGIPVANMASNMGTGSSMNSSPPASIFNDNSSSNPPSVGSGSSSANGPSGTSAGSSNSQSPSGDNSSSPSSSSSASPTSSSSSQNSSNGASGSSSGQSSSSDQGSGSSNQSGIAPGQAVNPLSLLQPTGPVDGPVIGAFITGVGSKVDRPSVKIYHGGKKYNQWEFIWNPLEDQAQAMQQGLNGMQQQPEQMGQMSGAGGIGGSAFGTGNTMNPTGQGSTMPGSQSPTTTPNSQPQ